MSDEPTDDELIDAAFENLRRAIEEYAEACTRDVGSNVVAAWVAVFDCAGMNGDRGIMFTKSDGAAQWTVAGLLRSALRMIDAQEVIDLLCQTLDTLGESEE